MEAHREAVKVIAANVKQFCDRREAFRIYHGSTNSTRPFERDKMVDTSKLASVLTVDAAKRTALVEPNVPMDELVDETLKHGLLPPVVMEFPGITVGGGFAGTSGESSSFKHGFFDNTVNWIEIVLANGEVVEASATEKPDLFYGTAGSFGTLGVTTLLEIQLIEAKSYVELTYIPSFGVEDAIQKTQKAVAEPKNDFVDGILFSQSQGVVMTGRLTSSAANTKPRTFTSASDPWFYLYARKLIKQSSTTARSVTIPLKSYLFRYDRGAFWTGRYAFSFFLTPFNRVTRFLLDPFMHTRTMYHALHASGHGDRYIVQDLALPMSTASEFIKYVDQTFGFYPLWLCPLKQAEHMSLHPHSTTQTGSDDMLLNIGVWGPSPAPHSPSRFVDLNRSLEQTVRSLGGMKWLYAHAYYTEQEFWEIYDRKWYNALRKKYGAEYLPDVWQKVRVDVDAQRRRDGGALGWWWLSGLWGVWKALLFVLSHGRSS